MEDLSHFDVESITDLIGEGVYVCDLDRRIVHWSKSAERITGWKAEDVVGTRCFDGILCHIDKDGHHLCGKEHCPLYRAMVTNTQSTDPLFVFAKTKSGRRIPTLVKVAPLRNSAGEVIGGLETFRDASDIYYDLQRAQAIQQMALRHDFPEDDRVRFTAHYIPRGIVGGDFYAIDLLADGLYGLMLADVMGHGVAAALYTMYLNSLWDRHRGVLLNGPAEFAGKMNNELARIVKEDESFATALCGLVDLEKRTFRLAAAGGPPAIVMHADGTYRCIKVPGLPLAIMENAAYEETATEIRSGDRILLASDGALEICNSAGRMLEEEGLIEILKKQGYPLSDINMAALEEDLLKFSNSIRLEDDLSLVEVYFR